MSLLLSRSGFGGRRRPSTPCSARQRSGRDRRSNRHLRRNLASARPAPRTTARRRRAPRGAPRRRRRPEPGGTRAARGVAGALVGLIHTARAARAPTLSWWRSPRRFSDCPTAGRSDVRYGGFDTRRPAGEPTRGRWGDEHSPIAGPRRYTMATRDELIRGINEDLAAELGT